MYEPDGLVCHGSCCGGRPRASPRPQVTPSLAGKLDNLSIGRRGADLMTDREAERLAQAWFKAEGFEVARIDAVPDSRRADLEVRRNDEIYIVEVKGRDEDEEFAAAARGQGIAYVERTIGRSNSLSKQVRIAAEQLRRTPAQVNTFRIIVLVGARDFPEVDGERFQNTLYGSVDIIRSVTAPEVVARPCYYLDFNEFYALRDVDAALLLLPSAGKVAVRLCMNNFSGRVRSLRDSHLYRMLWEHGAVSDPELPESQGRAYIADTDIDRHNRDAVFEYVKTKYGLDSAILYAPTHRAAGWSPKAPAEEN